MKRIIALVAALVTALGLTLAVAAPAQAYGWRGGVCTTQAGNNATVCVDLYTVPSGNGQKVVQIYICAGRVASQTDPQGLGFRGIKNVGVTYFGSAGNQIGGASINSTSANTCAYTNPNNPSQLGNGACFKVQGTLNLAYYLDADFTIKGKVYPAGAYNC